MFEGTDCAHRNFDSVNQPKMALGTRLHHTGKHLQYNIF